MPGEGPSTRIPTRGAWGRARGLARLNALPPRAREGPGHTRGHAQRHVRARSAPASAEKGSGRAAEQGRLCPRRGGAPAAAWPRSAAGRRALDCGSRGSASPGRGSRREGEPRSSRSADAPPTPIARAQCPRGFCQSCPKFVSSGGKISFNKD